MISRIDRALILAALAVVLSLATTGPALADDAPPRNSTPVRVLILSDGGGPDIPVATPTLRRILKDSGRFDARICESPAGLTARTLEGFDLVVEDTSRPPGKATADAISGFVESGKGVVITHRALSASMRDVPGYWPGFTTDEPLAPVHFLDVEIARPEHPIVRGMNARFRTADTVPPELAVHPSAEVISEAAEKDGTRKDGVRKLPVLLASNFGKGRVVGIALGHDEAAMHENSFRTAFARSCEWAATGSVTLPADLGPPKPVAGAVKAVLITGGHDHEAAFYSLFNGYADLDWLPVTTSAEAFKSDLRGKFDVVVMYDFSRNLSDAGKTNLRAFVEGGGGVVVLHHALLNYQNWDWWDDEAVGGSYRLTNPSSSVKDDQQIFVTPGANHPVTSGIAPFHIQDEAYKNMRYSPKIRPLLTTDNPTSDANLAWVGPRDGSRVVAIQLGHGHSAFGHPSYRALVHNAILWAAGKTK